MGGLANETTAVGAPTWWAAGYTGGSGAAPDGLASLAIMNDKIQEDQPLFQGVDFERPQSVPPNPPCGQASAGCEHGTEVAGMAIATGNSVCVALCDADTGTEKGIAYGVRHVLDASFLGAPDTNFNPIAWALGISQSAIYPNVGTIPGAVDPAHVMTDSRGSYTADDDSTLQQNLDSLVSEEGVTRTEPSGNDGLNGAASGHITDSCIAYNVLCAGGVGVNDPSSTSDDEITDFSSQGPSPAGRKKPDLVAIAGGSAGGANMTVVEQRWSGLNRLERGDTGTSFASPQIAGAATILYGAGITSPMAQKALLINSATLGRATPGSPMGTQTGWQPDWGFGELNLASAYSQRANTNGAADSVGAEDARFYSSTVASADRATLVWNRRSNGCFTAGCGLPHGMTLSNLDLFQYDDSQSLQTSSTSSIDNVEQLRAPAPGAVVYKVKDESTTVDGLEAEPFALAAANPIRPLTAPKPTVALSLDRTSARQSDPVTVTATLTNPSPDMAGASAEVALDLPAGVELTAGSATWNAGTLSAGATQTHQWIVKGTTDASHQISAGAQDEAYDETFRSVATAALEVDSTPPSPTISCPATQTAGPDLTVTWGATDASPISGYDVDMATDGGPALPWIASTPNTAATYRGMAGHSYRFAVRATDALGNASASLACGWTTIVGEAPLPIIQPPPTIGRPLPSPARLRVGRTALHPTTLAVSGTLARNATGHVRASYSARGRTVRASARVRRGHYRLTLHLPRTLRHASRGVLRIAYSGDARHSAQHVSRHLRR